MDKKENAIHDSCAWPINRGTVAQKHANLLNSHGDDHFEIKQPILKILYSELQEDSNRMARLLCIEGCIEGCIQCSNQHSLCVSVRNTASL
jgi:hypothetical protein